MRKCPNLIQKNNSRFEIQHIDSELSGSISQGNFQNNLSFSNRNENFRRSDTFSTKSTAFRRNKNEMHDLSRSPTNVSPDLHSLNSRPTKPSLSLVANRNSSSKAFSSSHKKPINFSSICNDNVEIHTSNHYNIIKPTSSRASSLPSDNTSIPSISHYSDIWENDSDVSEVSRTSAFESFSVESMSEQSFPL
eukprot:TRINITY_DN2228_c0_g1_i1.p1 TRINITY_DN2228_c0_g1~~TRINITY_DN2228_c0_g1_i1.p1  ORF type:complete len:192 (+),score=48.82 TRINITY_DN2228_c0_g1_i1:63-638(+)